MMGPKQSFIHFDGMKAKLAMSKYDSQPQFECQNRTLNVKMRYSGLSSNVKTGF